MIGTVRIIDLMFVTDLFEDTGEPDFMFEYVYQSPNHLYLKTNDFGQVK